MYIYDFHSPTLPCSLYPVACLAILSFIHCCVVLSLHLPQATSGSEARAAGTGEKNESQREIATKRDCFTSLPGTTTREIYWLTTQVETRKWGQESDRGMCPCPFPLLSFPLIFSFSYWLYYHGALLHGGLLVPRYLWVGLDSSILCQLHPFVCASVLPRVCSSSSCVFSLCLF